MKKRLIALLCIAALAVGVFTGCGAKKEETPAEPEKVETAQPETEAPAEEQPAEETGSELPYVELDWYTAAGEMPGSQRVLEVLNEYLLEKLNCKLNLRYFGADYLEKMPTMLQSGEDLGMVRVLSQIPYNSYAQQGAYYPLNDLLDQYGAGTKGLFSEDVWDSLKIDGNIYCVPTLKDNCYIMGYLYNADLADEMGIDMDNTGWQNGRDAGEDLLKFMEIRNELHPEWEGIPLVSNIPIVCPYFFNVETIGGNLFSVCNVPGMEELAGYDCDTVVNLYETDEFREFCRMQQRLLEAGVYAYDYSEYSNLYAEPATLMHLAWGFTWVDEHIFSESITTKLKVFDNIYTDADNYTSAATAISANCADPERAMMVIELFNTDPYVATLIRFGVEGEHWTTDENGNMTFKGTANEDPSNRAFYYWYGNDFGNLTITRTPEDVGGPDGIVFDKMIECNNSAKLAAHMGFVLNTDNIQNEIAACTNVVQEFSALTTGHYNSQEEVDAALDEMIAKLKANGVDKIVAECQAQIDAWNAAQK